MKFDPNPKNAAIMKAQCHVLMEEIFGTDKSSNARAYSWLKQQFGKQIRFSEITDENELRNIFERLWYYSFKMQAKYNEKH